MYAVFRCAGIPVDGGIGVTEKSIVKKIQEWFKSKGGVCYKVHGGPMSAGFPDLIGCIEADAWVVEVKVPNAKPRVPKFVRAGYPEEMQKWMEQGATVLQAKTLYDWQLAGAVALVATSVEDMERMFEKEYFGYKIGGKYYGRIGNA